MPVRSSSSRVLKWPDAQTVREAVVRWAQQISQQRPEVARIGLFGSYARGDWGVGSDIDLVVIVHHTDMPFIRRALDYDTRGLPVGADVLVYTEDEWQRMLQEGRFAPAIEREALWVYP
jgi:tRNA nucleotidyltransferase (CCA-adding enzyme)